MTEGHLSRRSLLRRLTGGVVTAAVPALPVLARGGVLWAEETPERGASPRPLCLSRDENAYGPSLKAVAAAQEAAASVANRYPELEAEALRMKIAALHGVAPASVTLGCGSTEIIRMAVDAFVGAGKTLIAARPTADVVAAFAHRARAAVVSVPLTRNRAHDLHAMLGRADARTGLVYISNPNGATGSLTPRREIEAFIRSLPDSTFVLIDEAYHHYVGKPADYASFIDRPLDDHRVIVTRSFSKVYGLAGLRVGYAISASPTARALASECLPDGVNAVAVRAALAALDDTDHVLASVRRNAADRQEFRNEANARMVHTVTSHANFVMLAVGPAARKMIEHFKQHDITIPAPLPPFDPYLRVSLGTRAEMHEFWRVWDLAPPPTMAHM